MRKRTKWEIAISSVVALALCGGGAFRIHENALPSKNQPRSIVMKTNRIQNTLNHISQQNLGKADVYYNQDTNTLTFLIMHNQYINTVKADSKPDAILLGQVVHSKVRCNVIVSEQAKNSKQFQKKEKSQQQTENRIIAEKIQEARQRAEERKEAHEAKIRHQQAMAQKAKEAKQHQKDQQQKQAHQAKQNKQNKAKAVAQNKKNAQNNQSKNKGKNKRPQQNRGGKK